MRKILDYLKGILGNQILSIVITRFVTVENIIKVKNLALDKVLDELEDYCAKNDITLDEKVLKDVREALNVPDNDVPPVTK